MMMTHKNPLFILFCKKYFCTPFSMSLLSVCFVAISVRKISSQHGCRSIRLLLLLFVCFVCCLFVVDELVMLVIV